MEKLIQSIIAAALVKDWILYAQLKRAFYEAQRNASDGGQALAVRAAREAQSAGLATF